MLSLLQSLYIPELGCILVFTMSGVELYSVPYANQLWANLESFYHAHIATPISALLLISANHCWANMIMSVHGLLENGLS